MSEQPGNTEEFSSQTDAKLYLALKAGHTAALGILYDRHAGLVYGLALKILGNAQEAEDLTQDIFLNLVKSTAYDSRRASLRTFLAILTRSRALDRVRSRNTALSFLERWRSGGSQETISQSPFEHVFQKNSLKRFKQHSLSYRIANSRFYGWLITMVVVSQKLPSD